MVSCYPYGLEATVNHRRGKLTITPRTENISRLDVYVNGRPARKSIDVTRPEREFQIKVSAPGKGLLKGFDGSGKLVAALRKEF